MQTIKRYPNRKLYHTQEKKYITLEGISELIRNGEEVQVLDHTTGEDLTAVTLSQIIFEQEKKRGGFLPQSVLAGLIRSGGDTVHAVRKTLETSLGLAQDVGDEIEARVRAMAADGDIDDADADSLIEKLRAQGRKIPQVAQPIEEKLQGILSKRGIPSREELNTLNDQIDALASKIDDIVGE